METTSISLPAFSLLKSQGDLEGDRMVVDFDLELCDTSFSSQCLVDSGTTGFTFIDKGFAVKHNLPPTQLQTPRGLEVIDGRPIATGHITHLATAL